MTNEIKFLIKCYFGDVNDPIRMAVNRAYRDMARTLRVSKKERDQNRIIVTKYLAERLKVLQNGYKETFDKWHIDTSYEIKRKYRKITYGQIQKWINMSIKYLYTLKKLGLESIDNYFIENTDKFHAPLDSYILNEIKMETPVWSKIETHKDYMDRKRNISFDEEYKEWLSLVDKQTDI